MPLGSLGRTDAPELGGAWSWGIVAAAASLLAIATTLVISGPGDPQLPGWERAALGLSTVVAASVASLTLIRSREGTGGQDEDAPTKDADGSSAAGSGIIEHVPALVARMSADGRILSINRQGRSWLGLDPEGPVSGLSAETICTHHGLRCLQRGMAVARDEGRWQGPSELRGHEEPIPVDLTLILQQDGGEPGTLELLMVDRRRHEVQHAELQRFRRLVEAARDAIFIIEPETACVLDVNEAACRSLGYSSQELVGRPVPDFELGMTGLDGWAGLYSALQEQGETFFDGVHQRQDGSIFPVEVNISLATVDGRQRIVAIARDVSEFQETRHLRDTFWELSPALLAVVDDASTFLDVNPAWEDQLGWPIDELIGRRATDLVHPDDLEATLENSKSVRNGAQLTRFENRYRTADGGYRWLRWTARRSAGGSRVLAVAADITEAKEQQAALERSEAKFQEVAANIHEVIWLAEPVEGSLLYVSPAFERVWGVDPSSMEEAKAMWEQAVLPADRDQLISTATGPMDGTQETEYRIRRPDGQIRWIRDRAFPIHDDDGQIQRVAGLAQDITDLKQTQTRRERSARQQARLVELEHLVQAASHNLKTPTRLISSFGKLLRRSVADRLEPEELEYLDHMDAGVNEMEIVLEGIKRYGEITANPTAMEAVDLEALIERVAARLLADPELGPLHLTYDQLPTVLGDSDMLAALLDELLTNAIENRGEEAAAVEVHADRVGERWSIAVTDHGEGFDAAYQAKVFKLFQSLEPIGEAERPGVGLTIAQRIVERHAGQIRASAAKGRGCTITFTLPALSDSDPPVATSGEEAPANT